VEFGIRIVGNIVKQSEPASRSESVNTDRIAHSRPTIEKADIRAVAEVLSSGRLADGSQVTLFERELSSYIGQKGGIATNSGTNALYLALLSLGHDSRNEVIIPSYACIALLNAISAAQLEPVVVDIDEYGFNIALNAVKKAMNSRTKAIIAPHMFGDPIASIQEIVELGIPVIEDCALSVGAKVDGRRVGSIAQLAVFSFYATKLLTTGHGGMVVSRSDEKLNAMKNLMQYDHRLEYRQSFNFRLTDFQAALGRNQLAKLDDFITRRQCIALRYNENFREINHVQIPTRVEDSIYFRYILQVEHVDSWITGLSGLGVDCRRPVFKPLHQYMNLNRDDYPNSERAYRHNISIPIYPSLTDQDVEFVKDQIVVYQVSSRCRERDLLNRSLKCT
jgi:perosamine synthetase